MKKFGFAVLAMIMCVVSIFGVFAEEAVPSINIGAVVVPENVTVNDNLVIYVAPVVENKVEAKVFENIVKVAEETSVKEYFGEEVMKTVVEAIPAETLVKALPAKTLVKALPTETIVKALPAETLVKALPTEALVEVLPQEVIEEVLASSIENIDLSAALENVDLSAALENVDLGAALENVDVGTALENTDLAAVFENVDTSVILENIDIQIDEFFALEQEGYESEYGDLVVTFEFATQYEDDAILVAMIGVLPEDIKTEYEEGEELEEGLEIEWIAAPTTVSEGLVNVEMNEELLTVVSERNTVFALLNINGNPSEEAVEEVIEEAVEENAEEVEE